jgi:WD40 repeat protein
MLKPRAPLAFLFVLCFATAAGVVHMQSSGDTFAVLSLETVGRIERIGVIPQPDYSIPSGLAWSNDGRQLVMTNKPSTAIFDLENISNPVTSSDLGGYGVAVDPITSDIAIATDNFQVTVVNNALQQIALLSDAANNVAFSADGQLLATGTEGITLWDTRTWTQMGLLIRPFDASFGLRFMQFAPDTQYLLSNYVGEVVFWSLDSGTMGQHQLMRQLTGYPNMIGAAVSNRHIATINLNWPTEPEGRVRLNALLPPSAGEVVGIGPDRVVSDEVRATGVAFSRDGQLLIYLTADGDLRFIDVDTGEVVASRTFEISQRWFNNHIAVSPQGDLIAFAARSGAIEVWGVPVQ